MHSWKLGFHETFVYRKESLQWQIHERESKYKGHLLLNNGSYEQVISLLHIVSQQVDALLVSLH